MRNGILFFAILLMSGVLNAQEYPTIYLTNPSFEDIPKHSKGVWGWTNCGFNGESPPDVQPFFDSNANWGQKIRAQDGLTYLGMVARDNDSYERVGQRLSRPMSDEVCYEFSIKICQSQNYLSATKKDPTIKNFNSPIVLRIWGGFDYCDRVQLLGESPTVTSEYWNDYNFQFKPKEKYTFIVLEAFYKTPTVFSYNGNILIDNASTLTPVQCDEEKDVFAVVESINWNPESYLTVEQAYLEKEKFYNNPIIKEQKDARAKGNGNSKDVAKVEEKEIKKIVPRTNGKRILPELDIAKIKPNQTIRIKNLYFAADTVAIKKSSYPVLDEIAEFIKQNPNVVLEIGGHTNGRPSTAFCDSLSAARAKSVADYLFDKDVPEDQLTYKGYGKRKPLASDNAEWGRQKNQRVEIKILRIKK